MGSTTRHGPGSDNGSTSAAAVSTPTAARIDAPQVSPVSSQGSVAPKSSNGSQANPMSVPSSGTLGMTGADWEEGGVRGVQIVDVFNSGSAQLAGLHKGDVIREINGKSIGSTQDMQGALAAMGPGTRVSIGYLIKTNLGWMPKETTAILATLE
jgi:S1-C subfamily serine protease